MVRLDLADSFHLMHEIRFLLFHSAPLRRRLPAG
jgi:hypothetical protein